MAAAVASLPAHVGRSTAYTRSPTTLLPHSPSSRAATRVRINPACVARPPDDDAKDRTAKRKRESYKSTHRRRYRDESPEPKRRRGRRSRRGRSRSPSRDSCRRTRHGSRRNDKTQEREREENARNRGRSRSRSGSSRSDQPRARRPDPCAAASAPPMPMPIEAAPVVAPRAGSPDSGCSWVMQDLTESFEEAEWRRRETRRKREEARREMDRVVQTVFFNDAFVSPQYLCKRNIVDLYS